MSVTEMIKVLPTQPGRYLAGGAVCSHGLQRQHRHQPQRRLQRRDAPHGAGKPLPNRLQAAPSRPPSGTQLSLAVAARRVPAGGGLRPSRVTPKPPFAPRLPQFTHPRKGWRSQLHLPAPGLGTAPSRRASAVPGRRSPSHLRAQGRCSPPHFCAQGRCWRALPILPLPPGAVFPGGCFSPVLFENLVLLLRNYLRAAPRAKTKPASK